MSFNSKHPETGQASAETPAKLRENPRYVALRLLGVRPRSVAELRERLMKKGFDAGVVEEVIAVFKGYGYLNDALFTRQMIQSLINRKPMGKRMIAMKLRTYKVSSTLVEKTLAELLPDEVEKTNVRLAAEKKFKTLSRRDLPEQKLRESLMRHLLAQGFVGEMVSDAVRRIIFGKDS